jgi:hypothetical protein
VRASVRAAGRRYQQGRAGRRNHARRQARYRGRLEKVTHQGSGALSSATTLLRRCPESYKYVVASVEVVVPDPFRWCRSDVSSSPEGSNCRGESRALIDQDSGATLECIPPLPPQISELGLGSPNKRELLGLGVGLLVDLLQAPFECGDLTQGLGACQQK